MLKRPAEKGRFLFFDAVFFFTTCKKSRHFFEPLARPGKTGPGPQPAALRGFARCPRWRFFGIWLALQEGEALNNAVRFTEPLGSARKGRCRTRLKQASRVYVVLMRWAARGYRLYTDPGVRFGKITALGKPDTHKRGAFQSHGSTTPSNAFMNFIQPCKTW